MIVIHVNNINQCNLPQSMIFTIQVTEVYILIAS